MEVLKFLSINSTRDYVSTRHMKLFTNLFGIAVAGVLGYLAEPMLRLSRQALFKEDTVRKLAERAERALL
jgi:hypothetical protein